MDLLSLPDELLDLVVTEAIQTSLLCPRDHFDGFPACEDCWITMLRSLRQVCKRLSRLYSVNANLFSRIQLIADCAHPITEAEIRASNISSYVEHIALIQPLYAPMKLKDFVELYASSNRLPYGSGPYSIYDGHSVDQHSQQERVGIHTMAELADGYDRYNVIATKSFAWLQSKRGLIDAWVPVLKQFSRCKSFEVPRIDYYHMSLDFTPKKPRHHPSWAMRPDLNDLLVEKSFKLARLFVPKAVACLITAGCKVESLHLSHAYNPVRADGSWRMDCDFHRVDLSALTNLIIEPYLPEEIYDGNEARRYLVLNNLRKDVQSFFHYSSSSLQCFRHGTYFNAWADTPVEMEQLTTVSLSCLETSSSYFSQWLAAMPQLTTLSIGEDSEGYMKLHDEDDDNWEPVFTTLRNHPNLVDGYMEIVFSTAWTLEFDKDNKLGDWDVKDWMEDPEAVEYFSKQGKKFESVLDDPTEFRRLLDVELARNHGDMSQERLGKFYIYGCIDWPGIEKLEKRRGA